MQTTERPTRRPFDHYETDAGTITAALGLIAEPPGTILDIGAGTGRWGEAARDRWPDAALMGVEIQPGLYNAAYDGWLEMPFPECGGECEKFGGYDLVFGNPPYRNVEAIVTAAIDLLSPTGRLMFLLPLRFLEGQGRRDGLFKSNPPYAVHVCSKRPSFQDDGKTNSTAFAVYLWSRNYCSQTELRWLK